MADKVDDGRWAPWWVYVILIVGSNLLKQYFIGGKVSDVVNVAITVAMVGVLILVITAVYRSMFATRRR